MLNESFQEVHSRRSFSRIYYYVSISAIKRGRLARVDSSGISRIYYYVLAFAIKLISSMSVSPLVLRLLGALVFTITHWRSQ